MPKKNLTPIDRGLKVKYSIYKYRHNKKFQTLFIGFELFKEMLKQDCYYCGKPSLNYETQRTSKGIQYPEIKSTGTLDRVDSNKGYEKDNVIPSCLECNSMKNNLTYSQFIQHITNIYNHIYNNNKESFLIKEIS